MSGSSERFFAERRGKMVEELRCKGIADEQVLEAMGRVHRHRFVDETDHASAYEDHACSIGYAQTISQPYTVAYMTSLVVQHVPPPGRVLEIGTGSGYQAAVLDSLGYRVYSVERIEELYERALERFRILGIPVSCRLGDGTLGWEEEAPFQAIMVTAAAPHFPELLAGQLSEKGCLVLPVGRQDVQRMMLYRKSGRRIEEQGFHHFAFVPLIGRDGWN